MVGRGVYFLSAICLGAFIVVDLVSGACESNCGNDDECVNSEACIDSTCSDPCENKECGLNTICVTDQHVARCLCPPGLTGDPLVKCNEGCSSNDDCWEQLKCINGSCVYPCYLDACGIAAFCEASDHEANCTCPEGHVGDPTVECRKICKEDDGCLDSQACINGQCANPCDYEMCGLNSICVTEHHEAECVCPDGLVGDPTLRCDKVCNSDSECYRTQQCIDGSCQYLCYLPGVCGISAVCETRDQKPLCSCPVNHTGDPKVQCFQICQDNSSCRDDQACVDGKCQDPCQVPNNPCGECAGCEVHGHLAQCACPGGYEGNPSEACNKRCLLSLECHDSLACRDGLCQDPCQNKTCGDKATCAVRLHIPKCYCREGYNGIIEPFCRKGLI